MNPETTQLLETTENPINERFSSNGEGKKGSGIRGTEMRGRRKTVQGRGFCERRRLGQKGSLVRRRRRRR